MTVTQLPTATTPLSKPLENLTDYTLRDWLRTQPAPVVAVVDIAFLEDHAPIVNGLYPAHADTFAEIRAALVALDAEDPSDDRDWLETFVGPEWRGARDARGLVESTCEDLRGDVQVKAMLLASLITRGAA